MLIDSKWFFQSSVSVLATMAAFKVTHSWLCVLIVGFFTAPRGSAWKRFNYLASYAHMAVLAAPYLYAWASGTREEFHAQVAQYVSITSEGMSGWLREPLFIFTALALLPERATYTFAWLFPDRFKALRPSDPVDLLYRCFLVFKVTQTITLAYFIYSISGGLPSFTLSALSATGVVVALTGQLLNAAMSKAIGKDGVFYGNRLADFSDWCSDYPFNMLVEHVQYVGAFMTVLGLALAFATEEAARRGLFGIVLVQGLWYLYMGFVEEFL